jgi:hypothetical protein
METAIDINLTCFSALGTPPMTVSQGLALLEFRGQQRYTAGLDRFAPRCGLGVGSVIAFAGITMKRHGNRY